MNMYGRQMVNCTKLILLSECMYVACECMISFLFVVVSSFLFGLLSLSRQKTSEHQAIWIVREGTSDVFNPSVKCNKYYESKKRSGEREMASDRLRQVRRGTTFDCR